MMRILSLSRSYSTRTMAQDHIQRVESLVHREQEQVRVVCIQVSVVPCITQSPFALSSHRNRVLLRRASVVSQFTATLASDEEVAVTGSEPPRRARDSRAHERGGFPKCRNERSRAGVVVPPSTRRSAQYGGAPRR